MSQQLEHTGLTRQIEPQLSRSIRRDGSYNVLRTGQNWRAFNPWLHVVNMSWPGFIALVASVYTTVNFTFAIFYFMMGPDAIHGSAADTETHRFLNDFFFSGHTLTTVGYGNLAPVGVAANLTATLEALVGLLAFSIITGLLVARASKPSARIEFSRNALIAPYEDRTGLMFRVANQRSNNLMELEATVILVQIVPKNGSMERRIEYLSLERDKVQMFPLTWTIVHPIDESSPLRGATPESLAQQQTEFIVLMKGFDETFSQTVHTRFSYRAHELVWNAKFVPAFQVAPEGHYILELDRVSDFQQLN
ncbi:MAG TPA: ion channel [Bryobacteraceae bacterium]|nr:ion channel [Bryobacteraceae bacterium]